MSQAITTVKEYLDSLSPERRRHIEKVRDCIVRSLPAGFEEGILWGSIAYYVPLSDFPDTYNKQPLTYVSLASQKNYMSLYLMCVYGDQETAFRDAFQEATGRQPDMGKSCLRFKSADELPLPLLARTIAAYTPAEYIERYKQLHA